MVMEVMRAYVRFRLPDGSTRDLCPGDLVGRIWSAALRLEDPRISEAHALVSLRGGDLKLLALRGVLAVDRKQVSEVVLTPGLTVRLSKTQSLEVLAVEVPDAVLAVEGPGLRRQILAASVYSLTALPRPELTARYVGGADAYLWSTGEGWQLQLGAEPPRALNIGDTWTLGERTFEAVSVLLAQAGQDRTQLQGRLHPPIRIVANYDTVHIHRDSAAVVALSGLSARIISELVAMDGPAEWSVLAGQLWRGEEDRDALRRKWDVNLARLRKKLRDAQLRPDLVKAGGTGTFELLLLPGDTVEDRT